MSRLLLLLLILPGMMTATAQAQADRSPSVSLGAGAVNVFRGGDVTTDFAVDLRGRNRGRFQPRVIATWSTDGARFVGAGLLYQALARGPWEMAIGFAPGYYEPEHGLGLGSALEFYSTIEVSRGLRNGQRVGACLGHISNGSIGDENPGTETLRLFWQVPLGARRATDGARSGVRASRR